MYSLRECEIKSVAERKRERERERESEIWAQNSKQNSFVEDNNHLAMHDIGMSKENI